MAVKKVPHTPVEIEIDELTSGFLSTITKNTRSVRTATPADVLVSEMTQGERNSLRVLLSTTEGIRSLTLSLGVHVNNFLTSPTKKDCATCDHQKMERYRKHGADGTTSTLFSAEVIASSKGAL